MSSKIQDTFRPSHPAQSHLRPLTGTADYWLLKVALCLAWHVVQTWLLLWASQPFFSEDSLVWHGFAQAISTLYQC